MTDKKLVKKIVKQLDGLMESQGRVDALNSVENYDEEQEKKILAQRKVSRKDHAENAEYNSVTQNPIRHPSVNRGK